MKKAKILILTIMVLSAVGGALAYKARTAQFLWCSHPIDGACDQRITRLTTSIQGKLWECTFTELHQACPPITVTIGN